MNTYHPDQIVAPTLLLLSDDEALAEFVLGVVKPPWRLIHQGGGGARMSDGSFAQPNVRLVILDDQAVEENDRTWLLSRIRRCLPGASLLYIARNQSETNEKRARANGAHYYASKPLSFERFGYVLQSFLRAEK